MNYYIKIQRRTLMSNRNGKKFRGVIGGYKRSDVNNYIKETDIRHSAETDELNEKLSSAESEIYSLKESALSFEEQKKTFEASIADAESEKNKLLDSNAALFVRNAELESEINSLKETVESLKSDLDQANTSLAEKSAQSVPSQPSTLEKVHARLTSVNDSAVRTSEDIISSARATAQKMILSAERECQAKRAECDAAVNKIRSETEEQAQFIRARLSKTAGAFLSNVSADLNESIESCIREINSCVNDMESEIKALLSKINSRSEEMNSRITYYQEYLAEGMEEKLSQIDNSTVSKDGDK